MKKLLFLAIAVALAAPAFADSHAKPDLADGWVMVVKDGHDDQFEKAFKEHLKYRASKDDPRAWKTYAPIIGDDLDHYVVRYCCVTYADMDEYAAWSDKAKVLDNWNKNVDPHVERYEHFLSRLDLKNNKWPDEDPGFKLFGVTSWQVKHGRAGAVEASKAAFSNHAKEGDWPFNWSWSSTIGGEGGLTLVTPYRNFAEMQGPEGGFFAYMAGRVGEEEAGRMLSAFGENFHSSNYTVYRLIDEMSMKDKK